MNKKRGRPRLTLDLDSLPKSRSEARRLGSIHYYTGPCKHGHDDFKYTVNSHCRTCDVELRKKKNYDAQYKESEQYKKYQHDYQKVYRNDPKNQERLDAIRLRYYANKNYGSVEEYLKVQAEKEERRQIKAAKEAEVAMRRKIRQENYRKREEAIKAGRRFYEGKQHTRCGTSTRYSRSDECVHCTTERNAQKRLNK